MHIGNATCILDTNHWTMPHQVSSQAHGAQPPPVWKYTDCSSTAQQHQQEAGHTTTGGDEQTWYRKLTSNGVITAQDKQPDTTNQEMLHTDNMGMGRQLGMLKKLGRDAGAQLMINGR